MNEHPLPLTQPQVQSILAGLKTQARPPIHPQPEPDTLTGLIWKGKVYRYAESGGEAAMRRSFAQSAPCPYGRIGDRLWVQETWTSGYAGGVFGTIFSADDAFRPTMRMHEKGPHFHATEIGPHVRWRSATQLPRWAARIVLEITGLTVQRLQDISEDEAQAEGAFFTDYGRLCFHRGGPPRDVSDCPAPVETHPQRDGWSMVRTTGPDQCLGSARMAFANYWQSVRGRRGQSWDLNPWVWVIAFRRIQP